MNVSLNWPHLCDKHSMVFATPDLDETVKLLDFRLITALVWDSMNETLVQELAEIAACSRR